MNKTRLPSRRTFVLDFCGCKIDELLFGYLQFHEILHVYIIGVYSQLERKMIDTWDIYYAILSSRKHDSELYKGWKNKLDVDLLVKDLKLVLSKDRPSTFHLQGEDKDSHARWHTSDCHLKGFLLATIDNALERFDEPNRPLINKPSGLKKCPPRQELDLL